jgi:multiple antibiotic resistance protein
LTTGGLVIDTFLLLLIGIGPTIALVPFLEATAAMTDATKALVVRKMLITAGMTAVILEGLGELMARLLHFSTGSLSIAGRIILVIIAVTMVVGSADTQHSAAIEGRDPLEIAVFPLAIPFLLNPAGIVTLVTPAAEAGSSPCSRWCSACSRSGSPSTWPCAIGRIGRAVISMRAGCSSPRRSPAFC